MEKFNQNKYIQDYRKQNYKQFKVELKVEEMDELNELLKKKKLNKTEFVKLAKNALEKGMIGMKYLVIKDTQVFEKRGNWVYGGETLMSKELKIFDDLDEAKNYYDDIKLEDDFQGSNRYSDFKVLYKYDSSKINDEDIEAGDYDLEDMIFLADEYSMTDKFV